jgi:nucleolar protein 53
MSKLLKVSGRDGGDAKMARIEHDGILTEQTYDLWGSEPAPGSKAKRPIDESEYIKSLKPATGFNKMERAPRTMKHAPQAPVAEAKPLEVPVDGRSYNPSIDAWRALIEEEHGKEEEREAQRLRLVEERARIQQIIENLKGNDVESSSEGEGAESEDEDDEASDAEVKSVNPPVKVKTKSDRQRRKQAKHEERQKLQAQLKELKSQIAILEDLPRLLLEEEEKLREAEDSQKQAKPRNKKVRLSKYKPLPAPLEIKLSDELTDSLRRLKPEGSLITDRFRSLQERGLVEARIPVKRRRRYRQKAVEKYQFKNITLK